MTYMMADPQYSTVAHSVTGYPWGPGAGYPIGANVYHPDWRGLIRAADADVAALAGFGCTRLGGSEAHFYLLLGQPNAVYTVGPHSYPSDASGQTFVPLSLAGDANALIAQGLSHGGTC